MNVIGWMAKENVVYTYNRIIFSHEKEKVLPFAITCMKLEGIMLTERRQKEKDKYFMIFLIFGILKS